MRTSSRTKALLRSLLAAYLVSAALLLALSFVFYKLKWGESQINLAVWAIYAAACLTGGFLCGKAVGSRRFFWGLLTGLLYFAILTGVSLATGNGAPADLSRMSTVLALCAAGGTIGGILS